jgi:hypothetical protein
MQFRVHAQSMTKSMANQLVKSTSPRHVALSNRMTNLFVQTQFVSRVSESKE